MSRQMLPGDISVTMVVWPAPNTMTAPALCYRRPRNRVIAVRWPYTVSKPWPRCGARDDAPVYRVHVDNVRRRDPTWHRRQPPSRQPLTAPIGWLQLRLFHPAVSATWRSL